MVSAAECGWRVAAGDADELAKLVVKISQMGKGVLQEKGHNGKAYYDKYFTKEKSLRKIDEIMNL